MQHLYKTPTWEIFAIKYKACSNSTIGLTDTFNIFHYSCCMFCLKSCKFIIKIRKRQYLSYHFVKLKFVRTSDDDSFDSLILCLYMPACGLQFTINANGTIAIPDIMKHIYYESRSTKKDLSSLIHGRHIASYFL